MSTSTRQESVLFLGMMLLGTVVAGWFALLVLFALVSGQ